MPLDRVLKKYPQAVGVFGDAQATRGKLLRGVAAAVNQYGLRECSVQHILEASGLSRRTFYKSFRSKEDALEALFSGAAELLVQTIEDAVACADSPAEKVVGAVDAYLDLLHVGAPLVIELQAESFRPESRLAQHRDRVLDRLTQLLDRNVSVILGQSVDPWVYRCLLMGMEGLILDAQRRGRFTTRDRARVRGAFLPVLLRALAPSGVHLARLPESPPPRTRA